MFKRTSCQTVSSSNSVSPVRTLSCLFNNPDFLKVLLHFEQLKCLSPVWILSCTFNVADSLKLLLHFEQLKGFLSMWILSWIFKVPAQANFLSHFEQLKGFFLKGVWILSCTFNVAQFLATLQAAEWFLSIVDSFLSLQMTWCGAFLVPAAEQIHYNLSYHAQKLNADMVEKHRVTTYMLTL